MTTHKQTRTTVRTSVAGIDIEYSVTWPEGDDYLAHKIAELMRTAITQPAAEQYLSVSGWDIRTVTTEHSRTGLPEPSITVLSLAGRNYDPEEGA
jgi:hypothetical protein